MAEQTNDLARRGASFTERNRRPGDPRHGTPSGANQHSELGELPCDACRAAKAEYDKRRLSSDDKAIRNRLHARAQSLANRDLRRMHEDEYRTFYLVHKENLLREVADYPPVSPATNEADQ